MKNADKVSQVAGAAPCHERLAAEEAKTTPAHRLLASFTHSMPVGPTQSPLSTRHQDDDLRYSAEAGIHGLLADGGGVLLGRAAAVVLGKDRGFHVRLDGPPARRIIQGATIEGISHEQASAHLQAADRARTACTAPTPPTLRCTTSPIRARQDKHQRERGEPT